MATVSDRVLPEAVTGTPTAVRGYTADIVTASDYYPFGMVSRAFNSPSVSYRYGFNGKEVDNEMFGIGNELDYGMRVYDPRVGRFLSVDPLTRDYAFYTPYQYAGNKPIKFTDLDGLEENGNSTDVKIRLMPLPVVPNKDNIAPVPKAYYFMADSRSPEQRRAAIQRAEQVKTMNRIYNSSEGWAFQIFTGVGASAMSYGEGLVIEKGIQYGAKGWQALKSLKNIRFRSELPQGTELAGTSLNQGSSLRSGLSGTVEILPNGGIGTWVDESTAGWSNAAKTFQESVTGVKAGQALEVNGYRFDGFKDGKLIDAKSSYDNFVNATGEFKSWFKGTDDLVTQAVNQLNAAKGVPIRWEFKTQTTLDATKNLLESRGIKDAIELTLKQ